MKTVEIHLYSFAELSKEGQEKAIENFRSSDRVCTEYIWEEVRSTIDKFFEHSGVKSKRGRDIYSFSVDHFETDVLELSGIRLATWIENNWGEWLFPRKWRKHLKGHFVTVPFRHPLVTWRYLDSGPNKGKYYGVAYSRIWRDSENCPLTGVCYDMDLLQPFFDFLKRPTKGTTLEDLIQDGMESLRISADKEHEYRFSDEAIREDLESNEYEFLIDGSIH